MAKKKSRSLYLYGIRTHRRVAEEYIKNPDDYLRTFTVQINGKKRHIITYKPDNKGAALRHYHELFANMMGCCYESMPNSYAYKKGTGILPCIQQHSESNSFLKTDIHEFFNSIQYETLSEEVLKDSICRRNKKLIKTALQACFYEGHLPIGFVTSPVLSDLYLHRLDELFLANNGTVYTRYADDFIISGKDNMDQLIQVKTNLERSLEEYGLSLNTKKTYFRTLRQPGDAIHVLGVNIVNNYPEPNRITVSDRYIREVCKEICQFFDEKNGMTQNQAHEALLSLNGKIEFIRYISTSSYSKLEKMVKIKNGSNTTLETIKLHFDETV